MVACKSKRTPSIILHIDCDFTDRESECGKNQCLYVP